MPTIAIVYHTTYGHTKLLAEAVQRGAQSFPGATVQLDHGLLQKTTHAHFPTQRFADFAQERFIPLTRLLQVILTLGFRLGESSGENGYELPVVLGAVFHGASLKRSNSQRRARYHSLWSVRMLNPRASAASSSVIPMTECTSKAT